MGQIKDITGKKFGKLLVLKEDGRFEDRKVKWKCQCDCGKIIYCRSYDLQKGAIKSCGCSKVERFSQGEWKIKHNSYNLDGEYGIGYDCNNTEFYFDLEDYDKIKEYCWHIDKQNYVVSIERNTRLAVKLHSLIMGNLKGYEIDHINGDPKDNRKENLRRCLHKDNSCNQKRHKNNTSGVAGVSYIKSKNKWLAQLRHDGERKLYKLFDRFEEAVCARQEAEEKYFKEFKRQ